MESKVSENYLGGDFLVMRSADGNAAAVAHIRVTGGRIALDFGLHVATDTPDEAYSCGACNWLDGQSAEVEFGWNAHGTEEILNQIISDKLSGMLNVAAARKEAV